MTNKFISAVFMLCFSCGVYAEKNCMTIEMKTGTKYNFLLDSNPVITYSYGDLVVNDGEYSTYEISRVRNYYFTETNPSATSSVSASGTGIVTVNGETVEVRNADVKEKVVLSTVAGAVLAESFADYNGFASIALPNSKGVYLLTIGENTIKVIRK